VRSVGQFFAILIVATCTAGTAAQQGSRVVLVRPPSSTIHFIEPWPASGTADTTVVGTVMDINKAPVAGAHVQLRELISGRVLGETDANSLGAFEFDGVDSGTYVVEMVLNGQVVALSNAGTLARYQSFVATVQLPGRWDYDTRSMVDSVNAARFIGLGSAYSMTAATLAMASAANLGPIDGGEPVSPQ